MTNDTLADLRKIDLPFNIDEVSSQCHKCIRKQLKKYEKAIDEKGNKVEGRFLVKCTGIPLNPVPLHLKPNYSDEEWEYLQVIADIVKWAEVFIKFPNGVSWNLRPYQKEILRCTSKRKLLRMSRRTGKTTLVALELIYYLFTESNIKLVVAGPQKTHTEEIMNRVLEFINSNPELEKEVDRYKKSPYYELKLKSGSRLRGFAAGAKGGNDGVAIRGQDADRLYCEEMDYIAEESIQGAILPLLSTSPNTTLVGFSTPTGYPTIYYRLCMEDPRVIEFHYSYKVLEHAADIELEKPNFTTEQWKHEYLAEFSGSDAGVYKPEDLQLALQNYKYSDYKYEPTWKYCIGTDWNEVHGTEIIVLGFNPAIGKFIVVDSAWIQKSDFTQLSGIAKLLEYNNKWNPNYIYIDSGNGSTNEELLRKTSLDARKNNGDPKVARLLDILRKYDSGSSLKIKDPVTREDIKMPAKPFMVNASVRLFEQHKIFISSEDSTLEKQLKNYLIVRLSPTKTPVYGLREDKIKDHRLDALNLAIVAFQLEFNELHTFETCQTFGMVLDPRTIHKHVKQIEYKPSDRRIEESSFVEKLFGFNIPARINFNGTITRENPGWDTDRESIEYSKRQQRLRSRRSINVRPTRTNI